MKKILFTLVTITLAISSCTLEEENIFKFKIDLAAKEAFTPYIKQESKIGLSVAVINGDQTIFYNYGETKRGSKITPTENSLYEIGSISKTFTAAMVTQLLLEKGITVHTAVSTLLPATFSQISYKEREITVEDLLNHTSGLPNFPADYLNYSHFSNPVGNYDKQKLTEYWNQIILTRAPGTVYEYSNLGYAILQLIITEQTGLSFANVMQKNIFQPLEMYASAMELNEISNADDKKMGAYLSDGRKGFYWRWNQWQSSGGIYSSLKDMEKYARAHIHFYNRDNRLEEVFRINRTLTFKHSETNGIGRAWNTTTNNGHEIISHNGTTGGFYSLIIIEPLEEKALIILSNNSGLPASDDTTTNTLEEISIEFFMNHIQS